MAVVVLEVPGDRLGAGVQAGIGKLVADLHDEVDHLGREGTGGGLGSSRSGFQCRITLGLVAGPEFVDPGAVYAVPGGDLGRCLVVDEQGVDAEG